MRAAYFWGIIGWLWFGIVLCQVTPEWSNQVNGQIYDDYIRQLAVSPTGNLILCGFIDETTQEDLKVAQFTPQGGLAWEYTYNDSLVNGMDVARVVAADSQGRVWVGGFSSTQNSDGWTVIQLDSTGQFCWKHTPAEGMKAVYDLKPAPSGNAYAIGYSSHPQTGSDFSVVKYQSDGTVKWIAHYNGSGNGLDIPYRVTLDDSENVLIAGYTTGAVTQRDITVVKYDSSGNFRWVFAHNGSANYSDEAADVAVDDAGNVYVTGFTLETLTGYDIAVAKINRHGQLRWIRLYNQSGGGAEFARRIAVHDSNQIYVAGGSQSKITLIKYNAMGDTVWVRFYYTLSQDNKINDMALDADGNIYLTGWTKEQYYLVNRITTLKYLPDGTLAWDAIYSVPGTDRNDGYGVAIDPSGDVLVSGVSFNGPQHYLVALKLPSSITNISRPKHSAPANIDLHANYPNPFNSRTIILFRNAKTAPICLDVYDATGRKVRTLVRQTFPPGEHRIIWDGTNQNGENLSSGVYFYRLQSGQIIRTGKMLLLQ